MINFRIGKYKLSPALRYPSKFCLAKYSLHPPIVDSFTIHLYNVEIAQRSYLISAFDLCISANWRMRENFSAYQATRTKSQFCTFQAKVFVCCIVANAKILMYFYITILLRKTTSHWREQRRISSRGRFSTIFVYNRFLWLLVIRVFMIE